jgi:hypothetical protein
VEARLLKDRAQRGVPGDVDADAKPEAARQHVRLSQSHPYRRKEAVVTLSKDEKKALDLQGLFQFWRRRGFELDWNPLVHWAPADEQPF